MNLAQLKQLVDDALASGVPENTIVCGGLFDHCPGVITQAEMVTGTYYDDPGVKLKARKVVSGPFLFLGSPGEFEWGTDLQYADDYEFPESPGPFYPREVHG